MQRPTAPPGIALIVSFASIMAACPEDDACLTECNDEARTSSGTIPPTLPTTGGPSSSTSTTGTTVGPCDASASSEESSTGQTEASVCGFIPGRCVIFGFGFCADVEALCSTLALKDVSRNFCAGLSIVCEAGSVAPCEICEGLTEQCVLEMRPIWECNGFAETCACLVSAHF
jgi:hypothetical protein